MGLWHGLEMCVAQGKQHGRPFRCGERRCPFSLPVSSGLVRYIYPCILKFGELHRESDLCHAVLPNLKTGLLCSRPFAAGHWVSDQYGSVPSVCVPRNNQERLCMLASVPAPSQQAVVIIVIAKLP